MESQKVVLYAGLESYRKDTLAGLISKGHSAIMNKDEAKRAIRECYEKFLEILKSLRKRYRIVIVNAYKSYSNTALYILYTDKEREYHLYAFFLPL